MTSAVAVSSALACTLWLLDLQWPSTDPRLSDYGISYDAMCRAIAEAHAVDEVKDIRDKVRAIEVTADSEAHLVDLFQPALE
jgi:hypothetical protein